MPTRQAPTHSDFYISKLNDLLYESHYYALLSQKYAKRVEIAGIIQLSINMICAAGTLTSGFMGKDSSAAPAIAITMGLLLIASQGINTLVTHTLKHKEKMAASNELAHKFETCFSGKELFTLKVVQGEATSEEIISKCEEVDVLTRAELKTIGETLVNERDVSLADKAGLLAAERMRRQFGCI